MSDDDSYYGLCYSPDEDYGGGGYSSPDHYGGNDSPDEDYHGGGYSSPGHSSGYSSEEDHAKLPHVEIAKPYSRPDFGSYESENTSKFQHSGNGDGKKYSAKLTDAYKAKDFVEKRTGNPGFKEEVTRKSYYKVDDKFGGLKTEYETQHKITKKVTITNPDSNAYNIDKSSSSRSSSSYADPTMTSNFKQLNIK